MNRKVALISSYCENEEKIKVLQETIQKLKENNLDVILISPLILPEKIITACDYFFYTKDNEILLWPIKVQMYSAYWKLDEENCLVLKEPSKDYGWAGLNQVKKLTEIALSFDYDYFYYLTYDLEIDENVINGLNNPVDCRVYSSQLGELVWTSGLHLIIFNKKNAEKLSKFINFRDYLKFLNSDLKEGKDALGFLDSLRGVLGFETPPKPVKDRIWINKNFFNHSRIEGSEFFLEKNVLDLKQNLKILFHGNEELVSFNININGSKKSVEIKKLEIFDLGVNPLDFEYGFLEHKGRTIDLVPMVKSIKYSVIKITKNIQFE
jgi:hypothetical protein